MGLTSTAFAMGANFGDLDNDGNEDIYIKMGGAYTGDAYENCLYLNPGQTANHLVNLQLTGTVSNKAAIGARLRVTFRENGNERSVFREVNSGGSFGSNPLRQHIGLGRAAVIDSLTVFWPVTGKTQLFRHVPIDTNIRINEDDPNLHPYPLTRFDLRSGVRKLVHCAP